MIERGTVVRHEPAIRSLIVSNVAYPSPSFRRLTLTGDDLLGFTSLGATDHVNVLIDGDTRRDYTPRALRGPVDGKGPELDIDFLLHGNGRAAQWAEAVVPGYPVQIGGPRGSRLPPTGASRVILGADESSLPALARWIEMLSDDTEIFGFIELENPSDAAYLDPDHVHKARIVWLDKSAGALERAIRGMGGIDDDTFIWVGGEATALIPLRRYVRHELLLPPTRAKVEGFWKHGVAGRDYDAPIDPSDPDGDASALT